MCVCVCVRERERERSRIRCASLSLSRSLARSLSLSLSVSGNELSLTHAISLYLSLWVCLRVSQGAVMPCSRAQTKIRGNPDRDTRVPVVHSTHPAAALHGRRSAALVFATNCVETKPQQGLHAPENRLGGSSAWTRQQLVFISGTKPFCTRAP